MYFIYTTSYFSILSPRTMPLFPSFFFFPFISSSLFSFRWYWLSSLLLTYCVRSFHPRGQWTMSTDYSQPHYSKGNGSDQVKRCLVLKIAVYLNHTAYCSVKYKIYCCIYSLNFFCYQMLKVNWNKSNTNAYVWITLTIREMQAHLFDCMLLKICFFFLHSIILRWRDASSNTFRLPHFRSFSTSHHRYFYYFRLTL